jgi:hypothetical protein
MIEQLLTNRDSIPYVIACACIVLALVVGYMFGHQDPAVVCADYIVKENQATEKALKLNQKLTECKITKVGDAVIDCQKVCDDQTRKALENFKAITCED